MGINVLHIRSSIGMYGAEQVILNIANTAYKSSLDNHVFIIEGPNPEACGLRKHLQDAGRKVDFLTSERRIDYNVVNKVKILSEKASVVHTHDYKSLILASMALIFSSVKIVHHVHGSLGNTKSEKVYAFIERIFMRNAVKIITVSESQRKTLVKKIGLKNKVVQINNGTDVNLPKPNYLKVDGVFTVIMVARFTPEKNHVKAIDVINRLTASGNAVELVLLGNGPECKMIQDYVGDKNLSSKVKFLGFTREVESWIKKSNLMLFTSTTEGLPISMLEAMACGLPILSTPVGEIPKILSKSRGGWVANDTDEITSKIDFLINNRNVLATAGFNGYEYVKSKLSIDNQLVELVSVYQEVVEDMQ